VNDAERVAAIAERLGLPAGDLQPALILEALRHGSWLNEMGEGAVGLRDNQRLEFLGDAVLGLLVSELCCSREPGAGEGELTRLRSAVVRAETLVYVARSLGLGELLELGRGEERSGGREKPSILADAMEALLAAVYLGGGLVAARAVVERLFGPLVAQAAAGLMVRDCKTELQEWLQARRQAPPAYAIVDSPGPQHARTFEVEVRVAGQAMGRGSGRTKKEAEQAAACVALDVLSSATTAATSTTAAAPPTASFPAPESESVSASPSTLESDSIPASESAPGTGPG
jgi:ribonuclease-3